MAKHDKRIKYHSEADKPVMLSLRVPRELNARLEHYASEHRQQVSELVREAIEMRLEVDADPRSRLLKSPTDEPLMQIDGASLLRDVRRMVQQEFEAFCDSRTALIKRIEHAQPVTDTVTDTHGQPEGVRGAAHKVHGVTATVTDTETVTDTVTVTGQDLEPFDTSKYRLGKLCPRGHDYHGTGQSLRVNNKAGYCLACNAATNQRKRDQKRQEVSA